ncbi:MAG: hypothetical protein JXX28_17975 [Deltaproteobacteria bacterium]|nr:hypothetical protein [Deltaproteobacteria bacterium]
MSRSLSPLMFVALLACTGPQGDQGPAGAAGASVLATATAEPAGDNCADGGTRVEYGVDANGDGTLAADEVGGAYFVCDGADGSDGSDAAGVIVTSVRIYAAEYGCQQGYTETVIGVDDGAGGGTAGDGALQEGEVDTTLNTCLPEDVDMDGVLNLDDNCVETANDAQLDFDGDAEGLACDADEQVPEAYAFSRGSSSIESSLYQLDLETGAATLVGSTGHAIIGMKFNPVDGLLYAFTRGDGGDVGGCSSCLLTLDTSTGAATEVVSVTHDGSEGAESAFASMAFLSDGSLYAWSEWDDVLVSVDTTTGVATALGDGENSWGHGMCATASDELLWINGDGVTWLIDPADGAMAELGQIPDFTRADGWDSDGDNGVRGDCVPDSLVYVGTDVTYGGTPTSLVYTRLHTDASPELVTTRIAPDENLHGVAFVR